MLSFIIILGKCFWSKLDKEIHCFRYFLSKHMIKRWNSALIYRCFFLIVCILQQCVNHYFLLYNFRDQTSYEDVEISDEETCNGEPFLKSLSGANPKDIDELKDFIECVPWRDYSDRIASKAKARRRRMQMFDRRLKPAKLRVRNTMESKKKLLRKER